MKEKLSVIIPLYHNRIWNDELKAVIKSIINQTSKPEIIISHQALEEDEIIKQNCYEYGIKYVNSLPDIIDGKVVANIGRVRNIGMIHSRGDYLYFTDADIVMISPDYIERLINIISADGQMAYVFPKYKRLVESSKNSFLKDYLKNKSILIEKGNYCFCQYEMGSIVPYCKGEKNTLIGDKPSVIMNDYVQDDMSFVITRENQYEQKWLSSFHYGGVLCTRHEFVNVGGYCETYLHWGMEDTDIQWKFKETCGVLPLYYVDNTYGLVHLEHKSNARKEYNERNIDYFEKRLSKGVKSVIESDKKVNGKIT